MSDSSNVALKRTPFYPVYEKEGKLIDFGGWDLPVQFVGIQKEHDAVREKAGLFDVSHMGEVLISGRDALPFLQKVTTNDVSKLESGKAQYSFMCYENGGVVDDLLVYKLGEDSYMLVINASNIDKDVAWLQKNAIGFGDLTILNISDETALLAVQGPMATEVLKKLTDAPIDQLKSFQFLQNVKIGTVTALISRTGYTGEDGFELYVRYTLDDQGDDTKATIEQLIQLWKFIKEVGEPLGLTTAGLGARDTLRFEARLPLYGQELSADITPIEAGLGFFVKPDKGEFIGREVLADQKQNGVRRKLVGIEMIDRGIPRSHYKVFAGPDQEESIGEVTTGTQSPTLKRNVGLALLDIAYTDLDVEVWVEIRGKKLKAHVVSTPFYRRKG